MKYVELLLQIHIALNMNHQTGLEEEYVIPLSLAVSIVFGNEEDKEIVNIEEIISSLM